MYAAERERQSFPFYVYYKLVEEITRHVATEGGRGRGGGGGGGGATPMEKHTPYCFVPLREWDEIN